MSSRPTAPARAPRRFDPPSRAWACCPRSSGCRPSGAPWCPACRARTFDGRGLFSVTIGVAVIGQRINNYEIVELIGEGGMGSVYMARHPFIDRKVAIKVLRASLANDPSVVHRFFNEAKAASAIHHPNIIEILDVGLLPDNRTPYLMMELLEGENVSKRIKRGLLTASEAVDIALQTASAVSAAHAQGIVHRDLKPE